MTMLATSRLDWGMLAGLAKQDILFVRGNPDSVRMVASGERALSPMISSFNIMTARIKGQPIDYYVLTEGSVVVQSLLGLMSDAPHPNAAKLLVEVMTSAEAESALSEGGVFWPAHPDAPPVGTLPKLAEPPSDRLTAALACGCRQYPGVPAEVQNGFRPSIDRHMQAGPAPAR